MGILGIKFFYSGAGRRYGGGGRIRIIYNFFIRSFIESNLVSKH